MCAAQRSDTPVPSHIKFIYKTSIVHLLTLHTEKRVCSFKYVAERERESADKEIY